MTAGLALKLEMIEWLKQLIAVINWAILIWQNLQET